MCLIVMLQMFLTPPIQSLNNLDLKMFFAIFLSQCYQLLKLKLQFQACDIVTYCEFMESFLPEIENK